MSEKRTFSNKLVNPSIREHPSSSSALTAFEAERGLKKERIARRQEETRLGWEPRPASAHTAAHAEPPEQPAPYLGDLEDSDALVFSFPKRTKKSKADPHPRQKETSKRRPTVKGLETDSLPDGLLDAFDEIREDEVAARKVRTVARSRAQVILRAKKEAAAYPAKEAAKEAANKEDHKKWFEDRLKRLKKDEEYQARVGRHAKAEEDRSAMAYNTDAEGVKRILKARKDAKKDGYAFPWQAESDALIIYHAEQEREQREREARVQATWKASLKSQEAQQKQAQREQRKRQEEELYTEEYPDFDDEYTEPQARPHYSYTKRDNAKTLGNDERRGASLKDLNRPELSDKPHGFLQRLKRFFSGS